MAVCFLDHYTKCDKQKELLNETARQGEEKKLNSRLTKFVITVNSLLENKV